VFLVSLFWSSRSTGPCAAKAPAERAPKSGPKFFFPEEGGWSVLPRPPCRPYSAWAPGADVLLHIHFQLYLRSTHGFCRGLSGLFSSRSAKLLLEVRAFFATGWTVAGLLKSSNLSFCCRFWGSYFSLPGCEATLKLL
jgi:hypothetical protein